MSEPMSEPSDDSQSFDATYRTLTREAITNIVSGEVEGGCDPVERARDYAERGKPDFALAYLLASALPDDEKREVFAHAYERRSSITAQRAAEFDRKFHREFPLLHNDAAKDRATARQIRAGKVVRKGTDRHIPMI